MRGKADWPWGLMCDVGSPYLLDTSGETIYCLAPDVVPLVEIQGFGDLASEILYIIERMPTYTVVLGVFVGLVMLFLSAMAVKELMS